MLHLLTGAFEIVREDRSGRERVDPDVAVSVVQGGGLREANDSVLGRGIRCESADGLQARGGGHVDDGAAVVVLEHRGDLPFHRHEHAAKRDGDGRVVRLERKVGERGGWGPASGRVVDGQVEPSERRNGALPESTIYGAAYHAASTWNTSTAAQRWRPYRHRGSFTNFGDKTGRKCGPEIRVVKRGVEHELGLLAGLTEDVEGPKAAGLD